MLRHSAPECKNVSNNMKSSHSFKFRKNDPDVVEDLLDGHPSPLGQGPFIYEIDHDLALHTVFRHSSDQECVEWDPVEKKGWVVNFNLKPVDNKNLQGPANQQLDMGLAIHDGEAGAYCTVGLVFK